MLVFDLNAIGNRLLAFRKRLGLTQADVAEASGLSDRTYADIERGNVNMRTETVLRICNALHVTPNEIFTEEVLASSVEEEAVLQKLHACSPQNKETALRLLSVYLESLK